MANVAEAQEAESRIDFKHKLSIALKDARETRAWLSLCLESPHLPSPPGELQEISKSNFLMLRKIVFTLKQSL